MAETPLKDLSGIALLDALSSGALICDAEGRIQFANGALGHQLHQEPAALVGESISKLIQLLPKADCAFCLQANPQTAPQFAETHSGFLLQEQGNGNPTTIKVKLKHSLLTNQMILTLIDPFSEDATLTQAHSDFVSTVSHEFRTPLTSIKGFADTLIHYGAQLPEEEKRRFVTIIKDQADRLIRLVENLLTASRVGAGRMDLSYRPVNLKRLLDKVSQGIQAKMLTKSQVSKQFSISVNPADIEVWGDADKLEQIFINLMDNAAKYSPADTPVTVRAEFLPGDDSRVRIAVQDQGPGIPAELLPRIFTQFYRVESPLKQEVEGTGLGLYITQSLTTAMDGQIAAESQPGQGSTFTVIFPTATMERQATHRRRLSVEEDA